VRLDMEVRSVVLLHPGEKTLDRQTAGDHARLPLRKAPLGIVPEEAGSVLPRRAVWARFRCGPRGYHARPSIRSLTVVPVGPVVSRPPMCRKKVWLSLSARARAGSRPARRASSQV